MIIFELIFLILAIIIMIGIYYVINLIKEMMIRFVAVFMIIVIGIVLVYSLVFNNQKDIVSSDIPIKVVGDLVKNEKKKNENILDGENNKQVEYEVKKNKKEYENSLNQADNYKSKLKNKRDFYLEELNLIKEYEGEEIYVDFKQSEIKEIEEKRLELWDKKLNEIYKFLKVNLPKDEFEKLKEKQINWISYRDNRANSAMITGDLVDEIYKIKSLAETTKERCYEFVEEYMN